MVLAGEWTNDHGPWCDDYFYFFVAGRPLSFYETPVYANTKLSDSLAQYLGVSLATDLAGSTDFNSRIMWPPEMKGSSLFHYRREYRGPGWLNRMWDRILPLVRAELAPEIVKFIQQH
jgi:hypothetical protein